LIDWGVQATVELGTNALKIFIDNINKNEMKTDESSRTFFSLAIYLKKRFTK
jgi:hypothetical protein